MSKSFCIIGLGNFGRTLATTLSKAGHQVLIVDGDADAVNNMADIVTNAVIGDPANESVLRAAGVKDYDCAVVCYSHMEDSILITLTLKDLGVKEVVARATSEMHQRVLEKVGADSVVFPERDMGEKLAYRLDRSNVMEYIEFSGEYSIVEIKTPKDWIGKSLITLDIRKKYRVTVIAVHDGESGTTDINPSATRVFDDNDTITLMGRNEDIEKVTRKS